MTTSNEHPTIDQYLRQAQQLWDGSELPDPDRLREIAESVGMSPEASEAADRRARQLTNRARQLLDDESPSEAEPLLRDAVLLSPVRMQPHFILARLYARRHGDQGSAADHRLARQLADRARELAPEHTPTRELIEELGTTPNDGLPWKKAALIVLVLVLISGAMQLFNRIFLTPEVTEEQTEEVRQYFEEHGEPPPQ